MRAVVADTGPLHYLILIDQIRLLPDLFEVVFVPEAVYDELNHPETPSLVRAWITASPPWLLVRSRGDWLDDGLQSLDRGERDAIALALSLRSDLVLMDDRVGVAAARSRGLLVTGTLGLLETSSRRGLVDLEDSFDRLRKTTFRCSPQLLDAILAMHRARVKG